ncbi:glycoside hydrolase superfamily [Mycena capillaripes]|nr:glycoside hydrolase superfamily [Mycena capillaripes]
MLPCTIIGAFLLLQVAGTPNKRDRISNSNPCDRIVLQTHPVEPFPPFDEATATVMRYRKQQSVNIGGLFVHEQWITPSVFEGASGRKISEIDIASGWGSASCARMVLENHWDTFMSDSDFFNLSSIGINTVRLPIGYWSLGPGFCQDTPFDAVSDVYSNSWSSIVHFINMAGMAGIGVLVDLHGAIGSQNGQPHSGISDGHAGLFNSTVNTEKTLAVLAFLTRQLCRVSNIVGIEILNEPLDSPELIEFYNTAISMMRQIPYAESFPVYIHDAFNLAEFSDLIANRSDFVVQDHHSYFVFTPQDGKKPASQHTKEIKTAISDSLAKAYTNQRGNLVVGEWSCALAPNSLSGEPDEKMAAVRDFCNVQLQVYSNTTAGWSFWTYKKEDCHDDPGWCFTAAVGTVLPSDFFSYTPSCNTSRSSGRLIDLPTRSDSASKIDSLLPPPATSKRTLSASLDRLAASHYRRWRRDTVNMTPEERSSTQGYSDGFLTAGLFCGHSGSRLGFIGQYIYDSIQALGPQIIRPATEPYYSAGFTRGLAEGEARSS